MRRGVAGRECRGLGVARRFSVRRGCGGMSVALAVGGRAGEPEPKRGSERQPGGESVRLGFGARGQSLRKRLALGALVRR